MSVLIRRAQPEDIHAIDRWEPILFGSDAWPSHVIREELAHPASYYLVAVDGSDVVGYAGLRAAQSGAIQGDIQTLAVAPDYRHQGLGRELLKALLEEASRRGVADVFLEVRADNVHAIELYASEGFREISRRRGYYQPDGVDAIVMSAQREKWLTPEGTSAQ